MSSRWSGPLKLAVVLCAAALLGGCSTPPLSGDVRGALIVVGSGAQGRAISAWRDGWVKDNNNGVSVSFSPDGQRVGIDALKAGNTYVATTDSPISSRDATEASGYCGPKGAFSIPVSVTPVAVAYNLGSVQGLKMDANVLSKIFTGGITSWDDPQIVELNPAADLPHTVIVPIVSSDVSPVAQTASTYLASASSGTWASPVAETWPDEIPGTSVSKYGLIPQEIDETAGSIAFLNVGDIGNRFNMMALKFNGSFMNPTTDPISLAIANSEVVESSHGVAMNLAWSQGLGYQLGTVSYQVFCTGYPSAPVTLLVRSWAEYIVSNVGLAQVKMATGNYAPSGTALEASRALVADISETN